MPRCFLQRKQSAHVCVGHRHHECVRPRKRSAGSRMKTRAQKGLSECAWRCVVDPEPTPAERGNEKKPQMKKQPDLIKEKQSVARMKIQMRRSVPAAFCRQLHRQHTYVVSLGLSRALNLCSKDWVHTHTFTIHLCSQPADALLGPRVAGACHGSCGWRRGSCDSLATCPGCIPPSPKLVKLELH